MRSVDVGAPPCEEGAVVTVGDVVGPGFGHRGERLDPVGSGVDAAGRRVPVDRRGDGPVAKFGERVAFAGIVLSDVVVEGDGELGVAVDERGERTAGSDGGELVVVTDEHERRVGVLDGERKAGEVGVVGHAGLVDDHDGVAGRG